MNLSLRPFTDEDICLFESWMKKEHVARWYHDPEDWLLEVRERREAFSFLHHFIVEHNDQPIGFCQYYQFSESGETWHGSEQLEGTFSIDYMIGEDAYLGRGIGKQIVVLLTDTVFQSENAERIIVQPEPENLGSCGVLLANGYTFDKTNELYKKISS
ncbi:GNAT family N-acetyltransferase [Enterococcus sp. LJL51]|uniref:GNAT family N-acetyltransferase n=1 Tax=Enterococcus sp. LJL51 TaxID=3416656 RepID=UPI003CEE5B7D